MICSPLEVSRFDSSLTSDRFSFCNAVLCISISGVCTICASWVKMNVYASLETCQTHHTLASGLTLHSSNGVYLSGLLGLRLSSHLNPSSWECCLLMCLFCKLTTCSLKARRHHLMTNDLLINYVCSISTGSRFLKKIKHSSNFLNYFKLVNVIIVV